MATYSAQPHPRHGLDSSSAVIDLSQPQLCHAVLPKEKALLHDSFGNYRSTLKENLPENGFFASSHVANPLIDSREFMLGYYVDL